MKTEFTAVLLAGGASKRMGRPKALVEVAGVPLWRRQMGLLRQLAPMEILISAGEDWAVEPGPWTVVRDRVPQLGPLGGIDAALRAMSSDFLLVLAVDMPDMSAEFLEGLCRAAGPKGIVPEQEGHFQGLAAIYPRTILTLLEEILAGDDRSLQHLVKKAIRMGVAEGRPIAEGDSKLFTNCNLPTDLRSGG